MSVNSMNSICAANLEVMSQYSLGFVCCRDQGSCDIHMSNPNIKFSDRVTTDCRVILSHNVWVQRRFFEMLAHIFPMLSLSNYSKLPAHFIRNLKRIRLVWYNLYFVLPFKCTLYLVLYLIVFHVKDPTPKLETQTDCIALESFVLIR